MNEDERYLFDLNGYLVLRGVLGNLAAAIEESAAEVSNDSLPNSLIPFFSQIPSSPDSTPCLTR